ncbi:carbohydrate esterase family 16 protein [Tulasnella calospora MUT 4182]|uniref:Carbohydrate esterase family 16 protein n=1 Tax=Tulasnella calospora MUT 4182 TaxID=1051891 RepID=A0A0C3QRQ4_9AGAM|nr:carbohydrate esterase family 16 protein [Tulasnella calospora MUT 4182]
MVHAILVVSSALALAAGANGLSLPKPAAKPNYWFSFGDSYTTTGFNVTTGPFPSASNPIGNPEFPGYTACGLVTNWVDDMTTKYNKTLTYLYNFAYGGATIDSALVTPYLPTVLSLKDQISEYLGSVASHPKSTPWTSSNSIFSFFIGINDIGNSWYQSGDRGAFADVLLDEYFDLVQKTYKTGARNFLFINVPGVDKSPLMLDQPVESQEGEDVVLRQFNKKLAARVLKFQITHLDSKVYLYDSHTRLLDIINHPAKYGFADATSYGADSDLMWCNNYHVSPGVHDLFAKDIKKLLTFTQF